MKQTIAAPRTEVSRYAPRMLQDEDRRREDWRSNRYRRKTIRAITEQTKATIDIEDDGTVIIGSADEASAKRAIEIVEGLTKEIEVGQSIPVK